MIMEWKKSFLLLPALLCGVGAFAADPIELRTVNEQLPSPGISRDVNNHDTASYMDSQVQAQLRLDLDQETGAVHFIRDNNDPRVVTKTYVLKHAEPYALRTFLRPFLFHHSV